MPSSNHITITVMVRGLCYHWHPHTHCRDNTEKKWHMKCLVHHSRGSHGLIKITTMVLMGWCVTHSIFATHLWDRLSHDLSCAELGDTGTEKLRGLPNIFIYSFELEGKHEVCILKLLIECCNMLFWLKNISIILSGHLTIEISETWYWKFINRILSLWCLWTAVSSLNVSINSTCTCRLCGW